MNPLLIPIFIHF